MEHNIEEYKGYHVAENGDVYSFWHRVYGIIERPIKLVQHIDKKGYCSVWLGGLTIKKRKLIKVHRLVANAYIPNPDNKQQVNHKDGNKENNSVDNLEWATQDENMSHAVKMGYFKGSRPGKYRKTVIDGIEYESRSEAARACGVCIAAISQRIKRSKAKLGEDRNVIPLYL